MFTGLVQTIGTVTACEQRGDRVLRIAPAAADFPLALGASIACNGICLTVTGIENNQFTAALSAETLRCTTAAGWQVGTRINLEPSLRVGDPLGGHLVSGHVDGLARVISITPSGDSTVWKFEAPSTLAKFIAVKGSVCLNGVSLTVNEVASDHFTVNIIAHTAQHTTFADLQIGDTVNLEVDTLARYVARMMETA